MKEPNSVLTHGVHGHMHEGRVSKRLNTEFASSCSYTNKYIQKHVKIPVLESILEKKLSVIS